MKLRAKRRRRTATLHFLEQLCYLHLISADHLFPSLRTYALLCISLALIEPTGAVAQGGAVAK